MTSLLNVHDKDIDMVFFYMKINEDKFSIIFSGKDLHYLIG